MYLILYVHDPFWGEAIKIQICDILVFNAIWEYILFSMLYTAYGDHVCMASTDPFK